MPEEIVGLLRSTITFKWEDGHVSAYPARELRLACRCAHCVEEMSGRPILNPTTVPANVRAKQIDLVGGYAITVAWTDGHATGIYSFQDLRSRCPCDACAASRPKT